MKLATIATIIKRIPRLALLGLGFLVMLAVTFAMVPPESMRPDVVAPAIAAAVLMLFCGPYLLAVGCTTGFLPDFGSFWGIAPNIQVHTRTTTSTSFAPDTSTAGSGACLALDSAYAVRRQAVRLPASDFFSRAAQEAPIASTARRQWSSLAALRVNRRLFQGSSTIPKLLSSISGRDDFVEHLA